jgi:hypothetical protein
MLDWLGLHKKRTCPECRAVVKGQPAPAYVVRPPLALFAFCSDVFIDKIY